MRLYTVGTEKIGYNACQQILGLHAFGGCDTTSAIFAHGKGTIFTKLSNNSHCLPYIDLLQDPAADNEQVEQAGINLMTILYGGSANDKLCSMHYASYTKMVSKSVGRLQPERLPPSERAAVFHAKRVHLQAVLWRSLGATHLDPIQWGWRRDGNVLAPITTDQAVAPDEILNVVRCKCKTGCSSSLCSCRKHNLKCVAACSHCHTTACTNVDTLSSDVELNEDSSSTDWMFDSDFICIDEEVIECNGDEDSVELVSTFTHDPEDDWVMDSEP